MATQVENSRGEHTRASTPLGPDYCRECSEAVSEWVPWPCPHAARGEQVSKSSPMEVRYHLQVRRGTQWGAPNVFGIEDGFEDISEAASLKDTLKEYDAEYYAGASWRIVEEVRTVVWEEIR